MEGGGGGGGGGGTVSSMRVCIPHYAIVNGVSFSAHHKTLGTTDPGDSPEWSRYLLYQASPQCLLAPEKWIQDNLSTGVINSVVGYQLTHIQVGMVVVALGWFETWPCDI